MYIWIIYTRMCVLKIHQKLHKIWRVTWKQIKLNSCAAIWILILGSANSVTLGILVLLCHGFDSFTKQQSSTHYLNGFSHWTRKFGANVWRDELLNRNNRSLWGYSHQARSFAVRKSKVFFFRPVCRFFPCRSSMKWVVQSDLSLDHVRGAAPVAQKGKEWWRCSENQCSLNKHRRVFSAIPREKRVDAEFLLSLVSENKFILTCS